MSSLSMFEYATGVFRVARDAMTSKAVSSIAVDSRANVTFPAAARDCEAYPIMVAVSVDPSGTPTIVNAPSVSAAAPSNVPSTTTLAPTSGSPVPASVTVPVTLI